MELDQDSGLLNYTVGAFYKRSFFSHCLSLLGNFMMYCFNTGRLQSKPTAADMPQEHMLSFSKGFLH